MTTGAAVMTSEFRIKRRKVDIRENASDESDLLKSSLNLLWQESNRIATPVPGKPGNVNFQLGTLLPPTNQGSLVRKKGRMIWGNN